MAGLYDCMDGVSVQLSFVSRAGTVYSYASTGAVAFNGLNYQKVTSCNGLAYYRLTNCFGVAQYDCDNDVYVHVGLNIECAEGGGSILGTFVSWIVEGKDAFTACKFVASQANAYQTLFTCPVSPIIYTIDFPSYFDTCVLSGSSPQAGIVYGNQADGAFTLSLTE